MARMGGARGNIFSMWVGWGNGTHLWSGMLLFLIVGGKYWLPNMRVLNNIPLLLHCWIIHLT